MNTIQKSVRLNPVVFDYINSLSGNGFNQKFNRMILYCMEEEKNIQLNIKSSEKILNNLNKSISEKEKLLSKLRMIEDYINYSCNVIQK